VRAPVLVAAGDGHGLAPRDAVVLAAPWTFDDRALALLGGWDPSLVRLTEARHDLVRLLGLRSVAMAEVVEQLPAQDPAWLHEIYDLFATAPADTLAELSTAPVPLVDGRVVHGARGLVLADAFVDAQALEALVSWGLRVIDPLAAHPVLERLGAQRMDADALARSEVLRGRVLGEEGDGDDEEAAATVLLRLLATGPSGVQLDRPEPWWGEALLTAHDGELVPARGLTLPGSPSAGWSDPEVLPPVADALVERWGDALVGLGVRSGLVVVTVDDPIAAAGLDGWADYLDDCGLDDHEGLGSQDVALVAVADLDAIRPDGWPAALAALAAGEARRALEPVRLRDGLVPSYTVWWLRHRSGLGLERPFALAGARRTGVATLLEGPPSALDGLDAGLQRALGGVASGADLDATGLVRVLHGASGDVDLAVAVDVWRAVARLAGRATAGAGAGEVEASMLADVEVLPVLDGSGARWAPADAVGVADAMWAQHPGVQPVVVVPTALLEQVADALDLDV
ncbi:MAG: ATP-binding protein, partial [Cellulomonadaceae bacterium]|nr:ATP-binding protein [Cellulomonadaceae bacterium]